MAAVVVAGRAAGSWRGGQQGSVAGGVSAALLLLGVSAAWPPCGELVARQLLDDCGEVLGGKGCRVELRKRGCAHGAARCA